MKFLFLLVLVVLLLAGVPVAYCVGFAAVIGMISNGGIHLMNISQATINGVNNFTLLAVPLFLPLWPTQEVWELSSWRLREMQAMTTNFPWASQQPPLCLAP